MMKFIEIYTDGGCRGNGKAENIGSWAACLMFGDHKKTISGAEENTTNNKMELKAVVEALRIIGKKGTPTIVYTDSKYVYEGATNWLVRWKMNRWRTSNKGGEIANKLLWQQLDAQMMMFKTLSFEWVKGHADNPGNIEVDRIVNQTMDTWKKQKEEVQ